MQRHRLNWPRRTLIMLATFPLLVFLPGKVSRGGQSPDLGNTPPPGVLVDVGGRRLRIHAMGKGAPTVVMEIGAGAFSLDWHLVQPEVAKFTRVCSYDRAGYAWSDPGPKPRTMRQLVFELRTGLQKAGIKGPYVLVGHSLGGLIMRVFAREYPKEVVGMVLVDSTHEDTQLFMNNKVVRMRELSRGRPIPPVHTTMPAGATSPEAGRQPPAAPSKLGAPFDRLPAEVQRLRLAAQAQAKFRDASGSEFDYLPEEMAQMRADRGKHQYPLGDLPLVVLAAGSSGRTPPGVAAEQWEKLVEEKRQQKADLARLSSNSKLVIAEKSGHEIHLYEPELVVNAIREVVAAARRHTRLNPWR